MCWPSLALAQAKGPGSPRLQPHVERLHGEVDAAVGLGLQGGQGAGRRQQREGLQQARQHHEQLQARQRLAQAHTRPAAKGQRAGARAGSQEAVCAGRTDPESAAAGTGPCAAPTRGHPVLPRTRPELMWPLPDRLVQVGALEVGDDNRALRDVVAEYAEGRAELETCQASACGPTQPCPSGVTCWAAWSGAAGPEAPPAASGAPPRWWR